MTPEQHNNLVANLHLAYAGLQSLILLGLGLFFVLIFANIPGEGGEAAFLGGFMAIIFFISWLFSAVPSFIAGYAMKKRKSWARIASIVASCIATINIPHGTALGVYSLWFLFGEKGNQFYQEAQNPSYMTPPQINPAYNPTYSTPNFDERRERETVYAPPTQPPDWR
ncbi:MAG: hypothetical protein MSG64_03800 [Pyrinomonadaceae bacterium MAG19_C2-C3]|nr:hypothetical protein [Pyrinomonadaceae bacterium MAG19_C2-C3]